MNRITFAVVAVALLSLTALASSTPPLVPAKPARTTDSSCGWRCGFARQCQDRGRRLAGVLSSWSDGDIAIGGRVGNNNLPLLLRHAVGWYVSVRYGRARRWTLDSADCSRADDERRSGGGAPTYHMMPTNSTSPVPSVWARCRPRSRIRFRRQRPGASRAHTLGIGKRCRQTRGAWVWQVRSAISRLQNKDIILSDKNWAGPSYGLRFSATFS